MRANLWSKMNLTNSKWIIGNTIIDRMNQFFNIPGGKSVFHNYFVDTIAVEFKNIFRWIYGYYEYITWCGVYMYHNAWSKLLSIWRVFFIRTKKEYILQWWWSEMLTHTFYLNLNKFISSDLILIVNQILINWSRFSPYRLCISVWISNLFFIILILRLRFIHRLYIWMERSLLTQNDLLWVTRAFVLFCFNSFDRR